MRHYLFPTFSVAVCQRIAMEQLVLPANTKEYVHAFDHQLG